MPRLVIAAAMLAVLGCAHSESYSGRLDAIQGQTICFATVEVASANPAACGTIAQIVNVSDRDIESTDTWLEPLSGYTQGEVRTFLEALPVFDATRSVWSDVARLNQEAGYPYLKFVVRSRSRYEPSIDAHCGAGEDVLSSETTDLYLSNSLDASVTNDIALPAPLTKRVLDSILLIAHDRTFQAATSARGGAAVIDRINTMLGTGLCGRYEGPSFGGVGVDRWEAMDVRGRRLADLDAGVRIAATSAGLQLSP